jgi:hypothetical protein
MFYFPHYGKFYKNFLGKVYGSALMRTLVILLRFRRAYLLRRPYRPWRIAWWLTSPHVWDLRYLSESKDLSARAQNDGVLSPDGRATDSAMPSQASAAHAEQGDDSPPTAVRQLGAI